MDFGKALVDPGSAFKNPRDVLRSNELSRKQKIKLLRQWEYDVRELQVADEESMTGPQPVTLEAVREALRSLGAFVDPDRFAPTKQGGS